MNKKIRVGIVGTGNLVSIADSHLKGYQDNANVQVVALYDVILENAQKWAKDRNLDSVVITSSYEELLSMVEAVSICTPNFTHVELVIKALEAGKHVLCEKPLSISYEDGKKALASIKNGSLINMIGFSYRFVPALRYMKEFISEGKLGEIFLYRETMGGNRLANPQVPLEWRMKRKFSGTGALTDFGSHLTDMAEYILGDVQGKIKEVNAFVNTFIKNRPVHSSDVLGIVENDDCAVFNARMERGALLSFTGSRVGSLGHKIEIIGSGGVLFYDGERPTEIEIVPKDINGGYERDKEILKVPEKYIIDPSFNEEINQFVDSIINKKQIQPDLARGLYIQYVIDSLEKSANEERTICL